MPNVFIYGTLKTDESLHAHMHGSELLCKNAYIKGAELVSCGFFPGLRVNNDPTTKVLGELWSITNETLYLLDIVEGCPNLFKRREEEIHCEDNVSTVGFVYEIQDYTTYRKIDALDGVYSWTKGG